MHLRQRAVLANILLFAVALTAVSQAPGPKKSKSMPARGNLSSEQLPFTDARNMTLMIFFADPPPQQGMLPIAHSDASGSGVWVGHKGYVATCHHVVANWHGSFKRDKVNLDIFWLKDESLQDSANHPRSRRDRRRNR